MLSLKTGMTRPSLYGAFGDKKALYRQVFETYRAMGKAGLAEIVSSDRPLRETLRRIYDAGLAIYLSGENGARGCFMVGTALTEAVHDSDLRDALRAALREFDEAFADQIRRAQGRGEIRSDADPEALGSIASAVLYSLSIRARAGETREALEATVAAAVDLICGEAESAVEDA